MGKAPVRHKLQFIVSRVGLMLFGLLAGLVLAELALRTFPMPNRFVLTQQLNDLWENDDELLLHLRPNLHLRITGHPEFNFVVNTNADGLRDDAPAGDKYIAAIGDSFTFGVEASAAWPAQLEILSGKPVANLLGRLEFLRLSGSDPSLCHSAAHARMAMGLFCE